MSGTLWQSLLGVLAGGVITLAGVIITQWWSGRHAQTDRDDRARQRRAEAYAEYLSAHQRLIVAIDQFVLGVTKGSEVEKQWAALSTTGYMTILLSRSQEIADGVNNLMRAALPLLRLFVRTCMRSCSTQGR